MSVLVGSQPAFCEVLVCLGLGFEYLVPDLEQLNLYLFVVVAICLLFLYDHTYVCHIASLLDLVKVLSHILVIISATFMGVPQAGFSDFDWYY